MKKNTSTDQLFFQPTFGNKPEQIVGRDGELATFINALKEPIGSRNRCSLILGQRGMGKTALLLEIAERAKKQGFITARVTAHENMPASIIEQIQLNGSALFKEPKTHISGFNAGALGFSFGLTFSESTMQQFGFRAKLSLLCDKLAEKGKGILILIDEIHTSPAMREVAASYQELVGDQKNIAMVMAGLPQAVSEVLNDKVLTFLNRANKVYLDPISINSITAYYDLAFRSLNIECSEDLISKAALKTLGLPYLMQLIGYYLTLYSQNTSKINENTLKKAATAAINDMEDNVFKPTIAPLSDKDRDFIKAMAKCDEPVTTAKLIEVLGWKKEALQPYRKRLIDSGIIESPRRGELIFAIPFLAEYINKQ